MILQAKVGQQSNQQGQDIGLRAGANADLMIGNLHGKYYEAARQGNLFMCSTVIAGKAIPLAAATLSATALTLHNPAGSGKVFELVSCTLGIDTVTTICNTVGLLVQRNLAQTGGIPTSTTASYIASCGPSTAASAAATYSAATLTNAQIPGVVSTATLTIPFYPMFLFAGITSLQIGELTHNFDGKLVLGPDSLVSWCTAVTAGATASVHNMIWAEYPV